MIGFLYAILTDRNRVCVVMLVEESRILSLRHTVDRRKILSRIHYKSLVNLKLERELQKN